MQAAPLHVIILAAGSGTRMKSTLPKVLQPLAGKTMLGHVLACAYALEPAQVHVVYGDRGEQVRGAFAADKRLNWIEQSERLGTGHAVRLGMRDVPADARVLVLYGDCPALSVASVQKLLSTDGLAALVSVVPEPASLGRVQLDAQRRIRAVVEAKDASIEQLAIDIVNTGILSAPATQLLGYLQRLSTNNRQGEYYLTQVFEFAAQEHAAAVAVYTTDAIEGFGANDMWELAQLERYLQARQLKRLCHDYGVRIADPARVDVRCQDIVIGRDVSIDVNVILEGKIRLGEGVHIGPNCRLKDCDLAAGTEIMGFCDLDGVVSTGACRIGPYARLRPGTELAEGTHVGNFVETKKTKLGPGSKANHLTYLGDAVIGARVNIGAGTITCNYDGVNKFTTRIDDDVFVGSNSALVAPLHLGAGATIGAGSTINKDAPTGQLTLSRAPQRTLPDWQRPQKK